MTFAIGQKVMCIKSTWKYKTGGISRPQFCHIYTVRAYCACADIPAILLEEITNKQVMFARTLKRGEASFAEYFFAPLEKVSEEIELETTA